MARDSAEAEARGAGKAGRKTGRSIKEAKRNRADSTMGKGPISQKEQNTL